MSHSCDRRDFIKTAAGLTIGATALAGGLNAEAKTSQPVRTTPPLKKVRMGMVGIGHQGGSHLGNFLRIDSVEIKAVCDIRLEKVEWAQKEVEKAGQPKPKAYARGDRDFVRMCEEEDLDLVFTATPWRWHVPVCVTAMKTGKHAATEIPAAVTIDECWELVETSEKTRKHCVMMENCCYDRTELTILRMVRQGLLGELLNAECGYLHDLRVHKTSPNFYQGMWRIEHSKKRNGDLYPTHGLGPVAQCMNINRGDQFDYLVSMSTPSRGLSLYAAEKYGPDSPLAREKFALGDVVTTLIQTRSGKTITLVHDTNSPRPYSRKILIQGTRGLVQKYPEEKIHIEGKSQPHQWEDLEVYRAEWEHPLWAAMREKSRGAGHGGMDYIEDYRLIECLLKGEPMDMDVYDAAAWSAISEATERSIARKSRPVDIPDFTRGAWKTNPPLGIVTG